MQAIFLIVFLVSFLTTLILTPIWIRSAKRAGLVGIDLNKPTKEKVAELGGIPVIFGFILGILTLIGIQTFYLNEPLKNLEILALLSSLLIITGVGFIDDILGWKLGLKQWQKPLLTLFAALPIVVINVGQSEMTLPLIGHIDVGILYPLLFVPLAIVFASNAFNLLAGYNGLEAGMGIIILSTLGFATLKTQNTFISIIAFTMVFSLIAFYLYNKHPSKIFPGDTMTYSIGALIAIIAIMGDVERIALIIFIPYFLEFILKLRGKLKKESFAKVLEDNSLEQPYEKIYGLEHLTIKILKKLKKKVYEKDVVYTILLTESILCTLVILFYLY